MSILDTLVAPLVAPLMLIGTMLPTGQSTVYATETHDIKPMVEVKTKAELMKERRKAIVSRSRQLANKTGTPKGNEAFAKFYILNKYGWGQKQFRCLEKIWTQE